jgi:hypothetical protein
MRLALPCVHSGNVGCVGALPGDLKNVPKTVVVEPGHCVKVSGEGITLACFKLGNEGFDVLGNQVFCRRALMLFGLIGVGELF